MLAALIPLLASAAALATPHRLDLAQRPHAAGPLLTASWLSAPAPDAHSALLLRHGHVELVHASLAELMCLGERPDVDRVELAWPLALQLVEGTRAVGLNPLGDARDPGAPTGRGVLVGIVDTGIDWTHPDFFDDDGHTRVAWLLDLSLAPRQGAHPTIDNAGGALWSGLELDEAIAGDRFVFSTDTLGHGTHIAGVVAGRGSTTGLSADGIAPDVDLIVVKATRTSSTTLNEADVLAGLRFILQRADALARPVVLNLSLGGHVGPHDGSSMFERALAELLPDIPGRVLVASAGNSGDDAIHAGGWLDPARPLDIPITIPAYERRWQAPQLIVVDLWVEAHDNTPIEAAFIAPDGRAVRAITQGTSGSELDPVLGSLSLTHEEPQPLNPTLQQIVVTLQEPEETPLAPGDYVIHLDGGRGRFDAWIASEGTLNARFGAMNDTHTRLTVPGTLEHAITVGAWVSSDRWVDRAGEEHLTPLPIGSIAPFSGTGPTRDGRPKPDLVAPGYLVASSLSKDADPRLNPDSIFSASLRAGADPVLPSQNHAVARGTSAATPFVSGAAALLLERDPTLTSSQLRSTLRATTSRPALASPWLWDPHAGFGLLNIPRALHHLDGLPGPLDPERSDVGVTRSQLPPEPLASSLVLVLPRDRDGQPLGRAHVHSITVHVTADHGQPELRDGRWLDDLVFAVEVAPGTARGHGVALAIVDGVPLAPTPRLDFEPLPDLRVQGGGCQINTRTPATHALGAWLLLAVMGGLITGRRRRSSARCPASDTAPRTRAGRDRAAHG